MVWMLGLGPYWPRTTIRTVPQAVYRSYCPVLYRKVLISAHFPLRGSEPEQASQCRRLGICAYKLHWEARGDYTNNISRVYSIIPTVIGPGGGYKTVTISPWNPNTRVNVPPPGHIKWGFLRGVQNHVYEDQTASGCDPHSPGGLVGWTWAFCKPPSKKKGVGQANCPQPITIHLPPPGSRQQTSPKYE